MNIQSANGPRWWVAAIGEAGMRRLNDYRFYELGLRLQPLDTIDSKTQYKSIVYELWFARSGVTDFLRAFPELNICRSAATELVESITEVVPETWADATAKDMEAVVGYKGHTVRTAKETFEHVLSAELSSMDTYLLTQQGIYNTADLVDRSEMAFTENTRSVIGEQSTKDFRQGGRCLAFELPTASGFHTMRATEGVLRIYHRLVKQLPVATRSPDMAICINELRAAQEDAKLIYLLDSVRDLHRNPQMHPEVFLTMEEALRLFDISKTAINAMADRIKALQPPAQPSGLVAAFLGMNALPPLSPIPTMVLAAPAIQVAPVVSAAPVATTVPPPTSSTVNTGTT